MESEDIDIALRLSFEEVNVIFKALGQQPFQDVYEIIGKINEQVNAQLHTQKPNDQSPE